MFEGYEQIQVDNDDNDEVEGNSEIELPDADEEDEVANDADDEVESDDEIEIDSDTNMPDEYIDADGETDTSFPPEVVNATDSVDAFPSSEPERDTTPWFTVEDLQSSWVDGDPEDHEIEGTWADICHEAQFVDLAVKVEHTVVGCSEWEIDVVEGDRM